MRTATLDRFIEYIRRADEDLHEFEREVSQPSARGYERAFALEQLFIGRGRSQRYGDTIDNLIERGLDDPELREARTLHRPLNVSPDAIQSLIGTVTASVESISTQLAGASINREPLSASTDFEETTVAVLRAFDSVQLLLTALSQDTNDDYVQVASGLLEDVYESTLHSFFEEAVSQPHSRATLRSMSLAFRASQLVFPTFSYHTFGNQRVNGEKAYPWWFAVEELDGQEPLGLNPDIDERLPEEAQSADVAGERWQTAERELAPLLRDVAEVGISGAIAHIGAREAGVGAGNINLIPSDAQGPCRPVLLVLSDGKSRFKARLREAHDHLIRCTDTRLAIFVTDYWDEAYYDAERGSTFQAIEETTGKRLVVITLTRGRLVIR